MSSPPLTEVPVTFFDTKAHGIIGRFRYPLQTIASYDGSKALPDEILDGHEEHHGTLLLPESVHQQVASYIPGLQTYTSQEGMHVGQVEVVRNCAEFVNHAANVAFDERLFEEIDNFGGWDTIERPHEHEPVPGEVMIYTRPRNGNWAHWAVGTELGREGSTKNGVLGLAGPNGHGLVFASSPDVAKALGHTNPNTAYHPDYNVVVADDQPHTHAA